MKTFIPDTKFVIGISSLLFIPTFVAYILYRIIPIQNVNPLSIVSVTASINTTLWIFVILQIFINYPIIRKYSIRIVVQFNLLLILIYVSTFKILIKALSLKGTPLPGSDIRGDLLAIYGLAKVAEDNFWSGGNRPGGSYPPLWPSLIGNFARILDVNVLYLFKPAEFIVLIILESVCNRFLNFNNALAVSIGSDTVYYFTGRLADVRLYNRALSVSEIQDQYYDGGAIVRPRRTLVGWTGAAPPVSAVKSRIIGGGVL
jgi:hypothetical protein